MTVPSANVVGAQLVRIEIDLILLHEAADRGHLGDPRHGLELVNAETSPEGFRRFREALGVSWSTRGVLVDPACARSHRAQCPDGRRLAARPCICWRLFDDS